MASTSLLSRNNARNFPPPVSAEGLIGKTQVIVEATDYERSILHGLFAEAGEYKWGNNFFPKRYPWRDGVGWSVSIGSVAGREISISVFWCYIDHKHMCFWNPITELFDTKQAEMWFKEYFPSSVIHVDAQNFSNAVG